MSRLKFVIEPQGLGRLSKKLNAKALLRNPVQDLIEYGAKEAVRLARERAPRRPGSGTLQASVSSEIKTRGLMPIAIIRAGVTTKKGFAYGYALNDAKHRASRGQGKAKQRLGKYKVVGRVSKSNAPYTYRSSGPIGKPTYRWFSGVTALVRKAMQQVEQRAAQAVERKWSQ